ncbi:AAA family ATPase [Nocardia ignorata]|uniref:nucleotide-binding protein n=1 Tax=Nocardia ignorata TaxID=145285 RepID=UPI003645D0C5
MSRNNDSLPMLPPWLSESEVTQVGYEAPVENLPQDEPIDEAPKRRRFLRGDDSARKEKKGGRRRKEREPEQPSQVTGATGPAFHDPHAPSTANPLTPGPNQSTSSAPAPTQGADPSWPPASTGAPWPQAQGAPNPLAPSPRSATGDSAQQAQAGAWERGTDPLAPPRLDSGAAGDSAQHGAGSRSSAGAARPQEQGAPDRLMPPQTGPDAFSPWNTGQSSTPAQFPAAPTHTSSPPHSIPNAAVPPAQSGPSLPPAPAEQAAATLPTRTPAPPSEGFTPLGPSSQRSLPDLPPPPPLPDPPARPTQAPPRLLAPATPSPSDPLASSAMPVSSPSPADPPAPADPVSSSAPVDPLAPPAVPVSSSAPADPLAPPAVPMSSPSPADSLAPPAVPVWSQSPAHPQASGAEAVSAPVDPLSSDTPIEALSTPLSPVAEPAPSTGGQPDPSTRNAQPEAEPHNTSGAPTSGPATGASAASVAAESADAGYSASPSSTQIEDRADQAQAEQRGAAQGSPYSSGDVAASVAPVSPYASGEVPQGPAFSASQYDSIPGDLSHGASVHAPDAQTEMFRADDQRLQGVSPSDSAAVAQGRPPETAYRSGEFAQPAPHSRPEGTPPRHQLTPDATPSQPELAQQATADPTAQSSGATVYPAQQPIGGAYPQAPDAGPAHPYQSDGLPQYRPDGMRVQPEGTYPHGNAAQAGPNAAQTQQYSQSTAAPVQPYQAPDGSQAQPYPGPLRAPDGAPAQPYQAAAPQQFQAPDGTWSQAPNGAPVQPFHAPDGTPHSGPAQSHHAPNNVAPQHVAPQYQQPAYGQPGWGNPGYQPPSLDNVPVKRVKKAPGSGWRKAVHHVSGGAINPGMSAEERRLQELVARIRQPVRGDYRIAVLSLKGGVGKTTTTTGLGSIFASIRGDRVIAVDANPDFGTLSQRVAIQTRSTVRDLLLDPAIERYSDVRRHTSQSSSRLEVLASERDPAASESFNDEEYRAVARILQRFYNIILTDCGTGLMHSAMNGVLDLAHSLVLISSAAIDGARSAAATLDWLSLHGHDHLVRNAVVVINLPREGSPNVGVQQLREYFLSRCRAVHIIPFDEHLSEGAEIDLHRLHKSTKRAYVELAATVADEFGAEHNRYR